MKFLQLLVWLLMAAAPASQAQGLLQKAQQAADVAAPAEGMTRVGHLQAGLIAERRAVAAGQSLWVGLRLVHDEHWHTYWKNPGDSGLPTRIDWRLPAGWKAGAIQWPTPKRLPVGPLANFGYEGDLLLAVELIAPSSISAREVVLQAQASWLVCKDVCIPGEASLALRLPVAADAKSVEPSADASLFALARERLPKKDSGRLITAHLVDRQLVLSWPKSDADEVAGLFLPYIEGLILPAAAQRLSKTEQGWRLDIPLGESSTAAVEQIKKAKIVEGIWIAGTQPGLEWRAALTMQSPPAVVSVVSEGQTAAAAAPSSKPAASFGGSAFWSALGAALLGGLILNLMPCVFPVIGLKVLSFAESAHATSITVLRALSFSAGVILTFAALGLLMAALRGLGEAIGWGFQLQNPAVVLGLSLLFVFIALNFLGVFEMGLLAVRVANLGFADRAAAQANAGGAFASGVLAVVVASPCTVPFMGSAIGFTATASFWETLLIFTGLGIGMSLPYLLMAFLPDLLKVLPRPGPWMMIFKQAMAFPMLAAAAWLIWVLAGLQGSDRVLTALMAAIAMSLLLWIYGRFLQQGKAGPVSLVGALVAFVFLVLTIAWTLREAPASSLRSSIPAISLSEPAAVAGSEVRWQAWAPGLAERLALQGTPVFVDFTASWCITCQANKVRVLQGDAVIKAFKENRVQALRADWTRQDPQIAAELSRHGRNGVPLYLVYRAGETKPRLLSEWLTDREVITALR
jgi:thiol:disulfide interchange protein DsbD